MADTTCTWGHKPAWQYIVKDPNPAYLNLNEITGIDPVQGSALDCYFIAALSSLAWTCLSQIKRPKADGSLQHIFFKDPKDLTQKVRVTANTLTETLIVDNTINYNQQAARSNTPDEIWPGIYEKMYAKAIGIAGCGGDAAKPDIINRMGEGNALFCLFQLTGWTQEPRLSSTYASGDALWKDLTDNLVISKKMRYPTVAWTKDGFNASGTAIVPKHSYSVLGTHTVDKTNYIVLRNPFGAIIPSSVGIYSGAWTYTDTEFVRGGGASIPPAGGAWFNIPLSLDTKIGLFGIEPKDFLTYFEGFGYID